MKPSTLLKTYNPDGSQRGLVKYGDFLSGLSKVHGDLAEDEKTVAGKTAVKNKKGQIIALYEIVHTPKD